MSPNRSWLGRSAAVAAASPGGAAGIWLGLERRVAGLRRRTATIGAFEMPYLEGGHGEPLVLVHGFGGDKDNFTRIARHLTPRQRVIVPDMPGFGEATRNPAARYRIADQVERLRDFLAALDLGPVHLGGNSMGGFIAAQYAATWPESVRSVWLLDAAGCEAAYDTPVIRHYRATGELPLLARTPADFDALLRAVMHRVPWMPRSLRDALARRAVADFELHTRIFREIGLESPGLEPLCASIRAPTLIVWGRNDAILSPAAATVFASLIARARVQLLDETGHLPMIERARATAAGYRAFLAAPPA